MRDGDEEAPAVPGAMSLGDGAGRVTDIASTDAASFALTEEGTLFGTGVFKDDGEMGFSLENPGRQYTPVPMAGAGVGQAPLAAVATGNTHVVLLTDVSGGGGGINDSVTFEKT